MMVHGGATRSARVSVQPRTEEAYTYWIRKYIRYCDLRHPRELAEADVRRFLSHLAVEASVAASTQPSARGDLLSL